jgi:hypothetical protein
MASDPAAGFLAKKRHGAYRRFRGHVRYLFACANPEGKYRPVSAAKL